MIVTFANTRKKIRLSTRGELEITDLNRVYLGQGCLNVITFGRGFAWLDTGTVESLNDAPKFVNVIEKREGIVISAPEEIAHRNGWISKEVLTDCAKHYGKSSYGAHLKQVADGKILY